MSGRRVLLTATLLVLPALASAQRSRAASGRDKELMGDAGKSRQVQLTVRDLEEASPLKLLIDKRKDLKLSDAQLSQLKDAESKLKEKVAGLYRIVDSVNQIRPPLGEVSEDFRAKQRAARQEQMGAVRDLRSAYDEAAKEALPTLDEEQQKKAGELLDKQKSDADKTIRDKLSGGRGGDRP